MTAVSKLARMPPSKRPAAMTPDELRELIAASPVAGETRGRVAEYIGVSRAQLFRWLNGTTTIGEANALLIRAKLGKSNRK